MANDEGAPLQSRQVLQDPGAPSLHILGALAAGGAISEQVPAGAALLAVVVGHPLVASVVPLHELIADLGLLREAGQLTGLAGSKLRTDQYVVEALTTQAPPSFLGLPATISAQRRLGPTCVQLLVAPFGRPVTEQPDAIAHRRARARVATFMTSRVSTRLSP